METESYETFIGDVLRPKIFNELREPSMTKPIRILVFENSNQPTREFVFKDLYPFETVSDLCTRIYKESDKRDEYHPHNLCLLMKDRGGTGFKHFLYSFKTHSEIPILTSPIEVIQTNQPNLSFVDIAGNSKFVDVDSRLNLLLESALPETSADEHVLYLFLYRRLYEMYTGPKPVDRVHWEGIFRV